MMTFRADSPKECGIVETDAQGVVCALHEKVANPPGDYANGAVYLIEPEVLDWLEQNPDIKDFSAEVLVSFLGRVSTWENIGIHRDIGTLKSLKLAQADSRLESPWVDDPWQEDFENSNIFKQLVQVLTEDKDIHGRQIRD